MGTRLDSVQKMNEVGVVLLVVSQLHDRKAVLLDQPSWKHIFSEFSVDALLGVHKSW
jgi:hypothetical protein